MFLMQVVLWKWLKSLFSVCSFRCWRAELLITDLKSDPGSPMVRSIPLWRSAILSHFISNVLDAAEDREDLTAGTAALGAELACEALPVAEAPVDDQPQEAFLTDRPLDLFALREYPYRSKSRAAHCWM